MPEGTDMRPIEQQIRLNQGRRNEEMIHAQPADTMPREGRAGLAVAMAPGTRRITLGPFGSRQSMLNVTFGRRSVWLETGCFAGTLDDFSAEIQKTYPEQPSITYGNEYRAVVDLLTRLADLYCHWS